MKSGHTYKGRPIEDLSRDELIAIHIEIANGLEDLARQFQDLMAEVVQHSPTPEAVEALSNIDKWLPA